MGEVIKIKTKEALLTEREVLEGMTVDQLVDYIEAKGKEVSNIERMMDLAADVLEGNGTSIEEQLDLRHGIERGQN